jgi:phospholipase C
MKQYIDAPTTSPLYQNAMTVQAAGQFELDAMNDNLPTVSWLFPTSYQSEHPSYLPAAGAAFVASKIDAVAANPDVWVGPGFRVPLTIISPWTAGGWVFSEQSTHQSHLMFLEAVTGVEAPNITPWRREHFSDLTNAFRFNTRAEPPVIPDTSGPLTVATLTSTYPLPAFPGAEQTPPVQPKGHRRTSAKSNSPLSRTVRGAPHHGPFLFRRSPIQPQFIAAQKKCPG